MKKIYISADIEGIWGNSNPANTAKNGYLYSEYCTNMMNEVNLVIDLLFQNGFEEGQECYIKKILEKEKI